MTSAVLIDKNGELKNIKLNNPSDITELYKKCGFRSEKGFELCGEWDLDSKSKIYLYGKKDGKAGTENKYEFPPPNDNFLLYGSCLVLAKSSDEFGNLTLETWEKVYEKLFGGFESLGDEDSESDDSEDEEVPEDKLTKHGYKKDGFVIDDESDDLCEQEYTGSELTDEEYYYSDD